MTESLFHFEDDKPNFETLARQNGFTYWYASDLMKSLGYSSIEAFGKAINRAMAACGTLNIDILGNFVPEEREEEGLLYKDYRLSRFACYLVTMNADAKKPEVASAQAFFATLAEAFRKYVQETSDVERILIRDDIATQEKSLSSTAQRSGVTDFALFKDAGYRGLYNMHLKQIKRMKGIDDSKNLYNFMGREEMAANLFRLTQTEAKLQNQGYTGQKGAENIAFDVGRTVRDTMIEISGNKPEQLPAAEDINQVKSALKVAHKGFAKLDANHQRLKKVLKKADQPFSKSVEEDES
jgi:DNA-damage-inducible protein D